MNYRLLLVLLLADGADGIYRSTDEELSRRRDPWNDDESVTQSLSDDVNATLESSSTALPPGSSASGAGSQDMTSVVMSADTRDLSSRDEVHAHKEAEPSPLSRILRAQPATVVDSPHDGVSRLYIPLEALANQPPGVARSYEASVLICPELTSTNNNNSSSRNRNSDSSTSRVEEINTLEQPTSASPASPLACTMKQVEVTLKLDDGVLEIPLGTRGAASSSVEKIETWLNTRGLRVNIDL